MRKVIWTAQELGLPLQRTDAGGQFGIVREPHYLRLNPNGLVPLIEDEGGVVLWESNTIVRYLCARYAPGRLYPEALPRAVRGRAMDGLAADGAQPPPAATPSSSGSATPPAQRSEELIQRSVAATEPLMALLDAHLARQPFMAGEHFTMADIPVGCEIHRWWGLPQERTARPHLERWYESLRARAGARGVLDQPLS